VHLDVTEEVIDADEMESTTAGESREIEQVEEEELIEDEFPDADPYVSTGFVVPEFSNLVIPLGSVVELICGFRNGANTPLNITAIVGSLNFAQDFRYYVQNVLFCDIICVISYATVLCQRVW